METIISERKRKRLKRNESLVEDFNKAMKNGSDKTAVYEYLAKKYGLKRASSVYMIIKKSQNN